MDHRFNGEGVTLVFYQKPNDRKFSFCIEDEPELTETLLANVKRKRIEEKDIRYAKNGIFKKIREIENGTTPKENTEKQTLAEPNIRLNQKSRDRPNYKVFANGGVRYGNLYISNYCVDGETLQTGRNWIVLNPRGCLYLYSSFETAEFQKEGCIFKKVKNAQAIADFIFNHRKHVRRLVVLMAIYDPIITIDE